MNVPLTEPPYVTSLDEVLWGGAMVAVTTAMYGFGLLALLRVSLSVKDWIGKSTHVVANLSWMTGNRVMYMNTGGGESF